MKKEETAINWQSEPLLLDAKDLQRIMRINRNHIYELFHQNSFPSIQIGKRFCIEKNNFRKWLQLRSWEREFVSDYKHSSPEEKELAIKLFWEAVSFLKDREADNIDRKEEVAELFSETE